MAYHVFQRIKKCGDIIKVYNYQTGFFSNYSKQKIKEIENKIEYFNDEKYVLNDVTGELLPFKENIKYIFNQDGSFLEKDIREGRQLQGTTTQEEYLKRRRKTLNADKNKIQDLINTNVNSYTLKGKIISPKFLTLTFKDNVQDLSYSNNHFKNYIKRLNHMIKKKYKNYEGLKYVCVIEFQKRGAIHYHVLFFNMPFIHQSILKEKWGLGSVYIEGFVKNNKKVNFTYSKKNKCFKTSGEVVKNVGAYITKTMNYMLKNVDDCRLRGQKCYLVSRGLKKPQVIDLNDCEVKKEVRAFGYTLTSNELVFINAYDNEYVGMCLCREYNINILKDKSFKFKNLELEHESYISAFIKNLYE